MQAEVLSKKFEAAARTGDMSLWLIQDRRSDECVAHAIVRQRLQEQPLAERYRDFRLMTLMDFSLADGDAQAASGIVGSVVQQFLQGDCDVLEIISNNRLVNRAATRRGLAPVGKGMSFAYAVPENWNWPSRLTQLENWPLTHFCGDGFSF